MGGTHSRLVYDLQGPDSQAVTMAPVLGSSELAYEMAEVYELALLHDLPLSELNDASCNADLAASVKRLNHIDYDITGAEGRHRKNVGGCVTALTIFRGSSPGVEKGPYLSQFMLMGNKSVAGDRDVTDGTIQYGALSINQRVPVARAGIEFMTD
jgi:hypothetical protein